MSIEKRFVHVFKKEIDEIQLKLNLIRNKIKLLVEIRLNQSKHFSGFQCEINDLLLVATAMAFLFNWHFWRSKSLWTLYFVLGGNLVRRGLDNGGEKKPTSVRRPIASPRGRRRRRRRRRRPKALHARPITTNR